MKRTILLTLLVVSTGVLSSSSSSNKTAKQQIASFNKTASAFKRDLGSAD